MTTFLRSAFIVTLVALPVATGCGTKKKLDRALDNANKLATEYQALAKNLNAAIGDIRASAKQATNVAPAALAKVPKLPATTTGGVNVTAPQQGKTGSSAANVTGDTSTEQVTAFVPDEGGDGAPAFASWQGSAASEDEGVCYLAWEGEAGKAWIVASACGDESGGFVCQVDGETAACNACNVEGQCNACDMETEDFQCTWPGGPEPAGGDAADETATEAP